MMQYNGENTIRVVAELKEMEGILASVYSALPEIHGLVNGVLTRW